jgi:hydrogenase maturation protease
LLTGFLKISLNPEMKKKNKIKEDILVLGIGNILLGDEGFGVHAVRMLEKQTWPEHIRFLDGGTGGFHLLSVFQQYKKIILIDAALDGNTPGCVTLLKPRYANDFPQTLSAHDIGLKDLVQSSALLGFLPEIFLVTISIDPQQPMSMELSHKVKLSMDRVDRMIKELIREM